MRMDRRFRSIHRMGEDALLRPTPVVRSASPTDDNSISSTLTANNASLKPEVSTTATTTASNAELRKRRSRRSVSFCLSKNTHYYDSTASAMTEADIDAVHYSRQDYQNMREQTSESVAQVRTLEATQTPAQLGAHRWIVQRTFEVCSQAAAQGLDPTENLLSWNERLMLEKWIHVDLQHEESSSHPWLMRNDEIARWGLERWTIKKLRSDKFQRRKDIVNRVLFTQTKLRHSHNREHLIRIQAEDVSRVSRLFAFCLGQAVAGAVSDQPTKIVRSDTLLRSSFSSCQRLETTIEV